MQANAEAAKRRIAQMNEAFQLRKKAQQIAGQRQKPKRETFGEAAARIARESRITI
jgi:hypothetical protein